MLLRKDDRSKENNASQVERHVVEGESDGECDTSEHKEQPPVLRPQEHTQSQTYKCKNNLGDKTGAEGGTRRGLRRITDDGNEALKSENSTGSEDRFLPQLEEAVVHSKQTSNVKRDEEKKRDHQHLYDFVNRAAEGKKEEVR